MTLTDTCSMGAVCEYRWRESYAPIWHTTRCEVLEHNGRTAKIRLMGFGKDGRRPGTEMRVQLKSLVGFRTEQPTPEWHIYSYFD